MVTVYDVPAESLISVTAGKLRAVSPITPPEWAEFVKTGTHREKAPDQPDWWYARTAAVLRKVYIRGPVGTERLASEFGGSRDRGARPNRAVKGSRAIIRLSLQQLEEAKLIQSVEGKGRVISPAGRSLLDAAAKEVMATLAVKNPELAKY